MRVRQRNLALSLLIGMIFVQPTLAESSKTKDSDRAFGEKWAIVIGVNEFQDKSWNFKYAIKDAQNFEGYLVNRAHFAKSHTRMLIGKNASLQKIYEALDNWLPARPGSKDLVVIYIRTRGTLPELDANLKTYLAVSDTNARSLQATGIEMDSLPKRVLERSPAAETILIVDSDFSGVMARPKSLDWFSLPDANLLPLNHTFFVICSAASNEISWESTSYRNSVFTHNLIAKLIQQGKSATLPRAANAISQQVMQEVQDARKRPQSIVTLGMSKGTSKTKVMLAAPISRTSYEE